MPTLYRAMKQDVDGAPLVVDTASGLGVRDWEVEIDGGLCQPETGGMSVAPKAVENLPPSFLPRELGGTNRSPAWSIEGNELGELLRYRADPDNPDKHGFVEPIRPMLWRNTDWPSRKRGAHGGNRSTLKRDR